MVRIEKIPSKRLHIFKDNNSRVLKQLSELGEVKASVDEDENLVIDGDGGKEWIAAQVIKALALGFESKHAFKLFKDDYFLEVISLENAIGHSEKKLVRVKARIIGTEGRVKKNLEALTGAFLSIDDNNVSVLGKFEELKLAKDAVNKIIDGKEISTVYAFLEKYGKML